MQLLFFVPFSPFGVAIAVVVCYICKLLRGFFVQGGKTTFQKRSYEDS